MCCISFFASLFFLLQWISMRMRVNRMGKLVLKENEKVEKNASILVLLPECALVVVCMHISINSLLLSQNWIIDSLVYVYMCCVSYACWLTGWLAGWLVGWFAHSLYRIHVKSPRVAYSSSNLEMILCNKFRKFDLNFRIYIKSSKTYLCYYALYHLSCWCCYCLECML